MGQPPYGAPRPAAKKNSGCWIALAIVGGLALVVGGLIAFGVYRFATSKEGRTIIAVVGEGATIMRDAQNAPGTKQLRGIGCKQAFVIDGEKLKKLAERFDGGTSSGEMPLIVMCSHGYLGTPPTCDAVARTYVAAASPSRSFAVNVQQQGRNQALCSSLYQPDGTRAGEFDSSSAPAIPVEE
jgi:hypothetical protein